MEVRVITPESSMKALATVDLDKGDMAMLSGGSIYIYGSEESEHRCGADGCDHASGCAVHNWPALPAGPCNCGAAE